jgi:hypothetical protein
MARVYMILFSAYFGYGQIENFPRPSDGEKASGLIDCKVRGDG